MKLDTLREVQLWDDAHDYAHVSAKVRSAVSTERAKGHLEDPLKFIDTTALGVWDLSDIAKAGMLLRKPKIPCQFENEHEMRRVYSLIYDVFRCKYQLVLGTHTALANRGTPVPLPLHINRTKPNRTNTEDHKIRNLFTDSMQSRWRRIGIEIEFE